MNGSASKRSENFVPGIGPLGMHFDYMDFACTPLSAVFERSLGDAFKALK